MIQGQRLYYPVSFIRNEKYYNEYKYICKKINSSNNIKKRQTPSSGSAMLLVMHVMFT